MDPFGKQPVLMIPQRRTTPDLRIQPFLVLTPDLVAGSRFDSHLHKDQESTYSRLAKLCHGQSRGTVHPARRSLRVKVMVGGRKPPFYAYFISKR